MIPVPPGPSDLPTSPEGLHPRPRGGEPVPPLVLQAFNDIDDLKRSIADLRKRLDALEHRLAGLGTLEQRVAALEGKG